MSPAYAKVKNVPKVESEDDAQKVLASIIPFAFFLRVDRGQPSGSSSNSPKHLQINPMQLFQLTDYYAWFYESSQWMTTVGGFAMLGVMLAGVMFPLWPPIMRLGVWYISIGVLGLIGLFIIIAILRLIFYIITVIVASPGIWIFPKLFADVGFVSVPVSYSCMNGSSSYRLNLSYLCGSGTCQRRRERRGAKSPRKKAKVRPPMAPARESIFAKSAPTLVVLVQRAGKQGWRRCQTSHDLYICICCSRGCVLLMLFWIYQ